MPKPMTSEEATELAVTTAYLVTGFNDAMEEMQAKGDDEKYEAMSGKLGGHTGITTELVNYARIVERLATKYETWPNNGFPGVFHYEMTEHFGTWLFEMNMPSVEDFETYADVRVRLWIAQ